MKMNDNLNKFDVSKLTKYPDPHKFDKVWQRSLWVLYVISNELQIDGLGISEIANFLTNIVKIDTSPQAVRYALKNIKRGLVNKQGNKYKLMEKGKNAIIIENSKSNQIYVSSNSPFTTKSTLCNELFSHLTGEISICDPYLGPRIFDLLLNVKKESKIRLLGRTIEDKPTGIFKRALQDMITEGFDIEVRIYDKSELHDRYIIDSDHMWLIGHSIKDVGKKESFIIESGTDLRESTLSMFNGRWKSSNEFN